MRAHTPSPQTRFFAHTHTHIYIYIYTCICGAYVGTHTPKKKHRNGIYIGGAYAGAHSCVNDFSVLPSARLS